MLLLTYSDNDGKMCMLVFTNPGTTYTFECVIVIAKLTIDARVYSLVYSNNL